MDAGLYAEMMVPYRDPATAREPPKEEERRYGRSTIPPRSGVGTSGVTVFDVVPVPMPVFDGRILERTHGAPSLDHEGYAFAKCSDLRSALPYKDFFDPHVVMERYFPEVEALVRRVVPGAADPRTRVLIFDHAVRAGGDSAKMEGVNPYSGNVHCDATTRSGHVRAKDQILNTNETEVKYGKLPACWRDIRPGREQQQRLFRAEMGDHDFPSGLGGEHMIVNVWRPLRGPVQQWPLAVCDSKTLAQGDVHPSLLLSFDNTPGGQQGAPDKQQDMTDLRVEDVEGVKQRFRVGEVLTPLHDKSHRWVVYPGMEEDEALFLKIFDSRRDGRARFCAHVALQDPHTNPDVHRESIEVRCLIILPKTTAEGIAKL